MEYKMKIYFLLQTLNYTKEHINFLRKVGYKYDLNFTISTKKERIESKLIYVSYVGLTMRAEKDVTMDELKNIVYNCTKELENFADTFVVGFIINYNFYTIDSLKILLEKKEKINKLNVINLLYMNYLNFINIKVNLLLIKFYKYQYIRNLSKKLVLLF